jgi:hypothetical protein
MLMSKRGGGLCARPFDKLKVTGHRVSYLIYAIYFLL